ncbi:MAG: DUF1565 domain-containing protein [Candidatus Gottesmanbacteria bacterium]|nr:DUF1565 domain-containing protein [Candidatus Gottesmanbacteria bacterium]
MREPELIGRNGQTFSAVTPTGPMVSLSDIATDNPGKTVSRVYLTEGIGNAYHDNANGTVAWVDNVIIGGDTYDFSTTSVTTKTATGVTTNDATLNALNKSAATGHSFWVSLAPFVTTSPTIPSGVYSSPDLGSIAANTDFSVSLASITTTGVPTNLPAITPGTTYYFAAWSSVGGTWYHGDVLNFTTAPGPVFIDTNTNGTLDPGELSFNTIQAAINAATSGNTIHVTAGTYTETGQIVIDKNLTIVGADKTTTIIKPAQDTGDPNSGNSRGMFLVNSGKILNLSNVTLDGSGKMVAIGILSFGNGTIENNIIKNIGYNPSGPDYYGRGIQLYDTNMTVRNNTLQNIGRIGIFGYGSGVTSAVIDGNNYTGKGIGNWLDYGIELGGGAVATISDNTINGNRGIASSDGSTSAGILVTTYFAGDTTATITGNTITNSTYGIAVGYGDGDTTSVPQFNTNTFSNNTYDLDNHTVNNIDARNNTWSVVNQANLDQIEAKINHNCSNSIYVHGVCSGTDDYNTGGMVRYKDIGTPTNSGWNVGSKSSTPNETPLDLACSQYTNENNVAQNWSVVNGANIKYQREVTFPSNAASNFEAGSNTYTPFSTFGSATGTEGLWKTRVRAYVDANNNNTYDSGEEVSDWSNECNITFDKTVPVITIDSYNTGWTKNDITVTASTNEGTLNTTSHQFTTNGSFDFVATDAAGNVTTRTVSITNIDKANPNNPGAPTPNVSSPTNSTIINWTWITASDALSGVKQYLWELWNTTIQVLSGTTASTGVSTSSLADETYTMKVTAEDNAGNQSGQVLSSNVTVDTTNPNTPTFVSSSHTTSAWNSDRSIAISWTATDPTPGSGIAGYSYIWNTAARAIN